MSILPILAQAAEVASEPNWIVIGALIGLFAVLAVILLIPPKKKLTGADAEKKAIEAKPSESKVSENKEDLSLAEIKVAKREAVAADMSKEELRELRKERRAATQTDKAVHERAENEDKIKENADDSQTEPESDEEAKTDAETATSESADALQPQDADQTSEDDKTEKESLSDAIGDVLTDSSTDASDVFASLFGSKKDDSLDIFGSNSETEFGFDATDKPNPANATVFPTLGSALIPLDELRKQSEESEADPLGELTKRLAAKAEKKNSDLSETQESADVPEPASSETPAPQPAETAAVRKQAGKSDAELTECGAKDICEDAAKRESESKDEARQKKDAAKSQEAAESSDGSGEDAKSGNDKTQRSLNDGLKTTRSQGFLAQIGKIFKGQMKSNVVDELEEILFTADIGVHTSELLLERVTDNLRDKGDGKIAMALLKDEVLKILSRCEQKLEIGAEKPHVILTIGVNGAGKTTTLGKLAAQLTGEGKKVLLIAGDTFRAAAVEQLDEWATRCGCGIYKNKQGADPSGTIFDGIKYAKDNGYDIALADTAGRLHNKKDLVEELKKIYRVSGKAMQGAPHQVILVLDATNGQNALIQARDFGEAVPFTGIILTKLDGTAKGGVILGICEEFKKPIHYIGIGEMIDDLRPFKAGEFVEALFNDENVASV